MSTCQGALGPHDDCPYGDACDWDSDAPVSDPRLARLNVFSPEKRAIMNRADRRAIMRGKYQH